MDRSQLYNQIAGMLKDSPGNTGSIGKTKVADKTPQGTKAHDKSGMTNHAVRTTNKQNPNKTYSFEIINKTRAKMGK